MNNITIVTAFFDIGREKYKDIPRSKEKYFEYFSRWARIKNDLIFVCENQLFADRVLAIRDSFGLKEKTHILKIDNIDTIEPQLLHKMEEIEKDEFFLNFRAQKEATENIGRYNYAMLLKYYSLYFASEKCNIKTKYLAWMDFGFEHGGEVFEDENDYSFEWTYDFGDKVTLFRLPYEEKRPLFEVIRTIHPDSITGAPVIVPTNKAKEFYDVLVRISYNLADIGLMDDDQPILLQASRVAPELVQVWQTTYWFYPISEYSNHKFKLKTLNSKKKNIFVRVINKIQKSFFKTK